MLKVGLHLTKNNDKYIELKNRLINQLDNPKEFNFIQLSSDNDITTHINTFNILHCYEIQPDFFGHASSDLKWIQIGAAGIEKSLFEGVLKSKVIITNASGIHADPVSEYVMSAILYFSKMFNDFEVFKNTKKWTQWDIAKKIIELKGKTIGIIGYGSIGKAIAKKAKLPGFRPGKAPINIIENQYGNQVNQEVLSEVLETTYAEVIQDQELQPAGPPEVSVDQFVDGSDFKYTANIEVLPEFKLKGIDDIKVEKLISTVTQSDINEMIENLQKQRGEWTVVDKLSEKSFKLPSIPNSNCSSAFKITSPNFP